MTQTHEFEISAYEARKLEAQGIVVRSYDGEDGYGHRFLVEESPLVFAILGI